MTLFGVIFEGWRIKRARTITVWNPLFTSCDDYRVYLYLWIFIDNTQIIWILCYYSTLLCVFTWMVNVAIKTNIIGVLDHEKDFNWSRNFTHLQDSFSRQTENQKL